MTTTNEATPQTADNAKITEKKLRDDVRAANAKVVDACNKGDAKLVQAALETANAASAALRARIQGKFDRMKDELGIE